MLIGNIKDLFRGANFVFDDLASINNRYGKFNYCVFCKEIGRRRQLIYVFNNKILLEWDEDSGDLSSDSRETLSDLLNLLNDVPKLLPLAAVLTLLYSTLATDSPLEKALSYNLPPFQKLIEHQIKEKTSPLYLRGDQSWQEKLQQQLKPNQLNLVILTYFPNKITHTVLMVGSKQDILHPEFLQSVNEFLGISPVEKVTSLYSFLNQCWENPTASKFMPCVFAFSTTPQENTTHISFRGIAPHYRKNGWMTNISLFLIKIVKEIFSEQHKIKSSAVHPATLSFYNPHVANNNFLNGLVSEEVDSCKNLLEKHENHTLQKIKINPKSLHYMGFFSDNTLIEKRHEHPVIQQEYDNRFGLIPLK